MRRWFLGLLLCVSSQPLVGAEQPDIVLITLDTTRADRMGFMGSKRGLTPNLDALSRQAMVFTRAYSQAPLTTVSHATIFTGTHPQFHRVNDFGVALPDSVPTITEFLKSSGYQTAAFVGSIILDARRGLAPGFDRGFDVFDAGYIQRRRRGEDRYKAMERRAMEVVDRAVRWLQHAPAKKPIFLWVHLFDPHDPYEPPEPYKKRFAKSLYDGEIAYTDAAAGKLINALRRLKRLASAAILVASDHGEALGQHGEATHGIFLYEETIHVPLLLKLPQGRNAGRRVSRQVGLVDVAPTLLELAGVKPHSDMQGRSLLRPAKASDDERASYSETEYPRRAFGWSALGALRMGKYLFVNAPRRELYNLEIDREATKNLAESSPAVTDTLQAKLQQTFQQYSSPEHGEQKSMSSEDIEKLGALGYVGGAFVRTPAGKGAADPKDKIVVANALHDAIMAVEQERYSEAVPLFERVIASEPQIYAAQYQLGIALVRQQRYADALGPLSRAVELLPDSGMAHYELGIALFRLDKWNESVPHFENAVARMPRNTDALFSLASVYARTDRVPEARESLQNVLAVEPDHYQANLLYGRLLHLQGDSSAAVPYLEKATKVNPASAEARLFLAEAYDRTGRTAEAEKLRKRSVAK